MGDLVFVELPEVGDEVSQGDEIVVIESIKAASDIVAPVDGEIIAINEELVANPELANTSAMGDGWFFKIKASDLSQLDGFMDEAAYKSYIS